MRDSESGGAERPAKASVLVFDDDVDICEMVGAAVRMAGLACSTASNASDFAVRFAKGIDILILDLLMPEMDGVEVIRFLAENKSRAQLILVSGVDRAVLNAAEKLARELGLEVIGCLTKPFRVSQLRGLLQRYSPGAGSAAVAPEIRLTVQDLQEGLRSASQFSLVYQPQIAARIGAFTGVEALLRWSHPQLGPVSPAVFVPLAEATGLIGPLTTLVVSMALDQIVAWNDAGLFPRVAINMSASALVDLELPESLAGRALARGIDPSQIAIEVTETSVAENKGRFLDVVTRLRLKGFHLSIDDFGTGFSSLAQLVRSPFSELKIDRGFITAIETDKECLAVVKASVALAHELGMAVVAEGVESDAIRAIVEDLGCDECQGYGIARPMSGEAVVEWARRWSAENALPWRTHGRPVGSGAAEPSVPSAAGSRSVPAPAGPEPRPRT